MIQIIAALCLMMVLCCWLKRRFEYVLPPLMAAGMLLLTLLAMLGKLLWVDGIAIALLVAMGLAVLFMLATRRIDVLQIGKRLLAYVITPGFVCFGVLLALFWVASEPMVVWWGDDVLQWALESKSLWFYNGLVDQTRHLNLYFATYTPGLQVVQWWLMHICGEWSEAVLYFGLFSTYVVFLLPLSGKIHWRQAYLMPLFMALCMILPIWGNQLSYVFLGVDTTLALCFGYVLVQIWRVKDQDQLGLLSIALGMCALVLIKQIGIVFAVMAAVLFLALKRGRKPVVTLACVLAPVLTWSGWMLFCNAMGLSGYHTSETFSRVMSMITGQFVPPEGAEGIIPSMYNALTVPYRSSITLSTLPWLHIPKLYWLIALTLAPLVLSFGNKERAKDMRKVSLFLALTVVVYLLIHYLSFFTTFYDEVGAYTYEREYNMVLLLERYMAPMLLGSGMLLWWMLMEMLFEKRSKALRVSIGAAGVVFCLFMALTTNWELLRNNLIPNLYIQQDRALGTEGEVMMDHDWGTELEGYEEARVLVGLERNSDYVNNLRYTFAPAKFFLPELYFMQSAETLQEYIRAEGITHLICFDTVSELYALAEELVEDDYLYGYELYEVVETDDRVTLVEFEP